MRPLDRLWGLGRACLAGVLCALVPACITPRTEIVARFETDMTQGPTQTLTAIVVRVYAADETSALFEQRFDLGVGAAPRFLPAELGIVPREASSRRVRVEVDAYRADTLLFTRHVVATFAPGRTLLLTVFLADRCRIPENRVCPMDFECGPSGCEPVERVDLPPFEIADAAAAEAGLDAGGTEGTDAGSADAGSIDAGSIDAGSIDSGSADGGAADAGCVADLATDPMHCGACFNVCPTPAGGAPMCVAGVCVCDPGFVAVAGVCAPIGPPQPIGPISMGRATLRAPTFVWRLAPGTDGARIEICLDPACATIEQTVVAPGTSGAATAALPVTPSSVHYFRLTSLDRGAVGTTTSPTWAFMIPNVPVARAGLNGSTSWPLLGDFELDGFGDVAVGAPGADQVHVFSGSAAGLPTASSLVLTGDAGSRFGASVRVAGDVNGDGRADLVIGAPGAGAAFVHLGAAAGLSSTGTMLSSPAGGDFGASVSAAGDVDGDGYGDVIVGAPSLARAYVYAGGPSGVGARPPVELSGPAASEFGAAVFHAGDVDGDQHNDVVVGAPGEDAAYVFLGGAAGLATAPAARLAGPAGARFGAAVAAGDTITGDALADVAVGGPLMRTVAVFAGSATGVTTTAAVTLTQPDVEFGTALLLGDTDENGFEDLYVGTGADVVWSFLSNSSGPGARAGWTTVNPPLPAGATGWGRSMSPAQIGADPYVDLVIGAPGSAGAYWFAGRGSGVYGAPDAALAGAAGSGFGSAVARLHAPLPWSALLGAPAVRISRGPSGRPDPFEPVMESNESVL